MKTGLRLSDQKRYFSDIHRDFMQQSLHYFVKRIQTMSDLEWEMNYNQEYSSIEDLQKKATMLLIRLYYKEYFSSKANNSRKKMHHALRWKNGIVFLSSGKNILQKGI